MSNSAERALKATKERMKTHGHPADVYHKVARLWSAYLDTDIGVEDVALMQLLFKMGREMQNHNEDNLTDMVGYTLVYERILEREEE